MTNLNVDKHSKIFFTPFEPGSLGDIYPKSMAIGVRSLDGLIYGKIKAFDVFIQSVSNFFDMAWVFIDGSIVRVYQYSAGAAILSYKSIGKSRDGNSINIHLAIDCGRLAIYFELSEEQKHDITCAFSLT